MSSTDSMKTLVVDADGGLRVETVPLPQYGPHEALVKTVCCALCNGTDTKVIHGTFRRFKKEDYPLMLGHEAVGRVIKTGGKVKTYKEGDHVLLPFAGPLGGYGRGWGAFSEYGVVTDAAALMEDGVEPFTKDFPLYACAQTVAPEWIDPVEASVIITLREVLSAVRYFDISPQDSVAVFGCGPVGLTFIKFLKLLGVQSVIALDIVAEKLDYAWQEGADHALLSSEEDIAQKIREIHPGGLDFVIEAAGVAGIINQAMGLIRDRGKICCYGILPNASATIDWSAAPNNWQLLFQQIPSKYEEAEADGQVLEWIKNGDVCLGDYISDIVEFKDILTAFEKLEKREIEKKCVIRYE